MDYSNVTAPFSFLPDSSKSIFFVKLSEDALQSLEEYQRMEAFNGFKPTIQFKDDKGIITMPCENGKVSYDFSLSLMDANRSQGSFQCMEKSEEGKLTSLGNIETKMQFHAKDASIRHTKSKIEAVDKKQKTYGAKVIKTATASQAISSQGSQKAFIKDSQERPPAPRRRKPVPLLKKFLNRNLQRQINKSLSSVNTGVSITAPNDTNHRPTVLSQTPLPIISKEINKKHVLEDSCDNYTDLRAKKQRISHSNHKEHVSVNSVLSSKTRIANGTKPEGVSLKSVTKLLPIPENKSKQDNQMRNCVEQLLDNICQEQKTKETEKKHALDNKIYSDPCKKKKLISQAFLNNPALTSNSADLSTSIELIPANGKPETVASKPIDNEQSKRKLENKTKRQRQKQKQAKKLEAAAMEAKIMADREVKRQAALEVAVAEAKRRADLERKSQATIETQRLANLEAQQLADLETWQLADLETQRQADLETKRLADLAASSGAPFSTMLRSQQSKGTLPRAMKTKGNLKNQIQLGNKSLVSVINTEEQAIDMKNSFKAQSSLNTSKSSVASTRIDGIQPQDPDSLRLKNKEIRTNGTSLETSGTSTVASKYIPSTLDMLPLKNTKITELINLPGTQQCVNDGCEVTSTTEKRINRTKGSITDAAGISSGPTEISMQDNFLNFEEIETFEDREECREVYSSYLEEYNKLQTDQKISRQYLESLEHTMTIHQTNSSVFYELEAKYLQTLTRHQKRLARRQTLSVHLSHLYNLMFKFDSKLKTLLI